MDIWWKRVSVLKKKIVYYDAMNILIFLNFMRLLNLGGRRNCIEKNIICVFGVSFSNYNISKQNSTI